MKANYILLFITGALIIASCKKSNQGTPHPQGKWQETKLRLYGDSSGIITYDTTYTRPFTSSDYISFQSNGTCIIGSDHYYYPNIEGYPKTPQSVPPTADTMKYTGLGTSAYLLNTESELTNPGGFVVADTIKVLSNNLIMLHSVFYSHDPGYSGTSDSYYQK